MSQQVFFFYLFLIFFSHLMETKVELMATEEESVVSLRHQVAGRVAIGDFGAQPTQQNARHASVEQD
jgi:hypothetical protein